jgi:hypothetical protein
MIYYNICTEEYIYIFKYIVENLVISHIYNLNTTFQFQSMIIYMIILQFTFVYHVEWFTNGMYNVLGSHLAVLKLTIFAI